jgi:type II secretory pathway pseudopilin PulG
VLDELLPTPEEDRPVHLRHLDRDRGASLIEVVIACVLLGILSSAVLAVVLQTQAAGVGNRNRVAASNLAAREIDMVRAEFFQSSNAPVALANAGTTTNRRPLEGGTAGNPLVVDGTPYTVRTSTQWNVTGTARSACDGGSLVTYPTLAVTVSVTWPKMGSIQPVVTSAALAPEKGDGVVTSTASFIAVRVSNADSRPNPGRGVAVSGGGSTVSGTTDTQGCAVMQVLPSVSGTAYTARITDAGYVDIGGVANPTRPVGTLTRGKLNNDVSFQVDRPATVNIRLVGDDGALLDPASALGTKVTLVGNEGSGGSNRRDVDATGPVTTVSGLWPTTYGAFVGATVPAGGYSVVEAAPGATVDLQAVVASARVRLAGMPDGTTQVRAVPNGGSCTDAQARDVDPGAVVLMPGSWNFYASGATFECATGPEQAALLAGDNGDIAWEPTMLQVTGAPEGVLWAANRARLGEAPASCPGPSAAGIAVNIDGARGAPVTLPAGDWFVYVTDGAAAGECRGVPDGQYSKVLAYGSQTVLAWSVPAAQATASALPRGAQYRAVAWTGGTSMSCRWGAPAGVVTFSKTSDTATSASTTLTAGTWRTFIQDTSAGTCTFAGTFSVDGSGRPLSLVLSTSRPGTAR